MDRSDVEDALADAEDAFQRPPTNVEAGLEDADEATVLQLRKACRLLDAAKFLRERNGHYTVVVEASFIAIERSVQFRVEHAGYDVAGQRHAEVYEQGVRVGLFSTSVADRLEQLWRENRSKLYYRSGKASERRADAMLRLAIAVHDHVVDLSRSRDCVCR